MVYIGRFLHLTNQKQAKEELRRHGEFNLIVEADSLDAAVTLFKERLIEIRNSSDLFEGDCSIFFVQALEFDSFPSSKPIMTDFKSIAGDPIMPFISCSVPSESSDSCRIFNWVDNNPEIDGREENLFLKFDA